MDANSERSPNGGDGGAPAPITETFYGLFLYDKSWLGCRVEELGFSILGLAGLAALLAAPAVVLDSLAPVLVELLKDAVEGGAAATPLGVSRPTLLAGGLLGLAWLVAITWPLVAARLFRTFLAWQRNRAWGLIHRRQWAWATERIAKRRPQITAALGKDAGIDAVLVEGRPHVLTANLAVALACVGVALLSRVLCPALAAADGWVGVALAKGLLLLPLLSSLCLARPDVVGWLLTTLAVGYALLAEPSATGWPGLPLLPPWCFEALAGALLLCLARKVWRSWSESRRVRYLIVSRENLRFLEVSHQLGASTTVADPLKRGTVVEDADGWRVDVPVRGGGTSALRLETLAEVEKLLSAGPSQYFQSVPREPGLLKGGRFAWALAALGTTLGLLLAALYVAVPAELKPARARLLAGDPAPLLERARSVTTWFPFVASAHVARAEAAAAAGSSEEAHASLAVGVRLADGGGRAGAHAAWLTRVGLVRSLAAGAPTTTTTAVP